MKTTEAILHNYICPKCKGDLCKNEDSRRCFVRHYNWRTQCAYGKGEKDTPEELEQFLMRREIEQMEEARERARKVELSIARTAIRNESFKT